MIRKDLLLDIRLNPRDTEDSRIVASRWNGHADPYISGILDAQARDENELNAFFAITAERLLYRGKVLGFPIDENLALNASVQAARPFGSQGPTYAELSAQNVLIAAAFVPLTPGANNDDSVPVLARLYCVTGLDDHYDLPFLEGGDATGIKNCSWFVAGVKSEKLSKGIQGRSWLLAAHLLMRVLRRKDKATATNLAKSFIVTGDVDGDRISRVSIGDMGRKMELGKITEFRSMKWIMPSENANGQEAAMKNRIEKPATLEEAYELIEHMSNRATRSLFRFLKASNLDGIKDEYKNGADIFADDDETGKGALQIVSEGLSKAQEALCNDKNNTAKYDLTKRIESQKEILAWLQLQGLALANSKTFYLLAKLGMAEALELFVDRFPINVHDEKGLTAVDYALLDKNWDVARQLHLHGGHCDSLARDNLPMARAIEKAVNGDAETRSLVRHALSLGLVPDAQHLFTRAIMRGDGELVEACIKAGRDPNANLTFFPYYNRRSPILAVAEDHDGLLSQEKQLEMIELLRLHGGDSSPEMNSQVKSAIAHSFIYKAIARKDIDDNLAKALAAIKDGILHYSDEFFITVFQTDEEGYTGVPDDYKIDLFALAIGRGWLSVVEACLQQGASPMDMVSYFIFDYNRDQWVSVCNGKAGPYYPASLARKSTSGLVQQQLLELLRKFIPQGVTLPSEAMP